MAERNTIARPYAEAAFRTADSSGKLPEWAAMLAALAEVAGNERVKAAIADPNLPAPKVAGVFISILAGKLTGEAENLVRVLAENTRLELLPEIRVQFEALKDEREGVVEAQIISAFELDAAQRSELTKLLEHHTGRKVRSRVDLDKELIGGVRVVIGDKVIDASVRAQLHALESALKS
jgi:F-type H+-transporting ATPase subunit delta